jgi:hypothetical protein
VVLFQLFSFSAFQLFSRLRVLLPLSAFSFSAFQLFRRLRVLLPLSAFSFSAFQLFSQDALRLSLNGQSLSSSRLRDLQEQPHTIQWGDFRLLASASLSTDWNDNINLSSSDPENDVIFRPMANLDAAYQVTDLNALSFTMGLGYEAFVQHSEYDRFLITPGSQLGWNITVKDLRINLHDRFSYEQDPTLWGAVVGTARYGGFYNTVGLLAAWDLHDATLYFGYDHFNFIASSSRYEYLSRASDYALLRAAFQVHPSAIAGLEASGGPTTYEEPILSDNVTYSLGAFAEWQVTEHIKLLPRAGYYQYFFSDDGLFAASEDQSGYYLNLRFEHDLRQNVNYSLEGGHESYIGNLTSLTEQWYARASINWRIIKNLSLTTGLGYENATQPLAGRQIGDYDRLYANLRVSCRIKPKLVASTEYRLWLRDSKDFDIADYTQNRLSLQLTYQF